MKKIGNMSVGDKFTETGLVGVSTLIYTVEKFTTDGLVIARDVCGWGRAWNHDDTVAPWMLLPEQEMES